MQYNLCIIYVKGKLVTTQIQGMVFPSCIATSLSLVQMSLWCHQKFYHTRPERVSQICFGTSGVLVFQPKPLIDLCWRKCCWKLLISSYQNSSEVRRIYCPNSCASLSSSSSNHYDNFKPYMDKGSYRHCWEEANWKGKLWGSSVTFDANYHYSYSHCLYYLLGSEIIQPYFCNLINSTTSHKFQGQVKC